MIKTRCSLIILLSIVSHQTLSKDKSIQYNIKNKKTIATKVEQAPLIDGKLNDFVWQQAEVIDDFLQIDPVEYASPSEKTEVRILYDQDFLYIGTKLWDTEADKIVAKQKIQGQGIRGDDRFEVHIDTFHDQRNAYFFQTNVNGVRRDALLTNSRFISDWSSIWYVKTHRDQSGWSAEFAIPFKTLSFDPNNTVWGITFSRTMPRKQEEVAWSFKNRRLRPANYGDLNNLSGMNQGLGLDITPSLTAKWSEDDINNINDSDIEPSLDMFYKVTESTNAALSLNTDFSATEVDDQQINLTRFSLFLPEKRDFFLQDANIFEFGGIRQNGRPYFSRMIGLDENDRPIDINYGLRVSGQSDRLNFGLLFVEQDETSELEKSKLAVARASLNILNESSLGIIATSGDPNSNQENHLIGADFNYRSSEAFLNLPVRMNLWFQQSNSQALSDDAAGFSFEIPIEKHNVEIAWMEIGENFDPALGFVNRSGVREMEVEYKHRYRPDIINIWRAYNYEFSYSIINDLQGNLESKELFLRPLGLYSDNGDLFALNFIQVSEVLTEAFEIFPGHIIDIGRYRYSFSELEIDTGQQRNLSSKTVLHSGSFYNGKRKGIQSELDWWPSSNFALSLIFDYNEIELVSGRFITRLTGLSTTNAFNSDWSWINIIQYENESNTIGLNSRLRYFPEPGKEWFFIYNKGYASDSYGRYRSQHSEAAIKASYLIRF